MVKFVAQAVSTLLFVVLILTHSYEKQLHLCSFRFTHDPDIQQHWRQHRVNLTSRLQQLEHMCIRNLHPSVPETLIIIWIAGNKDIHTEIQNYYGVIRRNPMIYMLCVFPCVIHGMLRAS